MPLTDVQNKERRDNLVSRGGLKPDTLQRRQKAAEDFDHFIQHLWGPSWYNNGLLIPNPPGRCTSPNTALVLYWVVHRPSGSGITLIQHCLLDSSLSL